MKKVIFVIAGSVLIGIGIFFIGGKLQNKDFNFTAPNISGGNVLSKNAPQPQEEDEFAPTPRPSLPPLSQDSNLSTEIEKLGTLDYSEQFKKIKSDLAN